MRSIPNASAFTFEAHSKQLTHAQTYTIFTWIANDLTYGNQERSDTSQAGPNSSWARRDPETLVQSKWKQILDKSYPSLSKIQT